MLHTICYAFNHKFEHGEEWGEIRDEKGNKLALLFAHHTEGESSAWAWEVRTLNFFYPDDFNRLIGIFKSENEMKSAVEKYYNSHLNS